ncbi:TPA: tail fiber domain-containing protein [Salmonella enterica subsp. enterica serovar Saintpaul]
MAIRTKIIVQQILNIDDTTTTASKYPKYTVVLGNSISSITAGELTAAVEASAASAAAAKDSEIAAKESETNAKDSENLAAIYADSSQTSATQSAASAAEAERQAGLSQKSAEASATSAEESKGFRNSAELAAQNAETSRRLAEQAKTAAQQAQTAAETAKTGAETAKTEAEAAATTAGEHAAAAKQSELNAKESETNAAGSAVEAGDKAVDATAEADRAKAEADRATQVVDGKLDKVDISGFIKVYKTKEEADADVANRVLDEKVLVWNQTDSKYGWYKVAGTAEAPVLELVEVEQKLVSINNVHADDTGNVQITLPGGNPSLWLGEVTWFPYDKDSGVGYPGVLPADGREVLRVDYPDTWEAIEAGLIPSVTEEEWQAGATLYFSKGNGTTTFRLPDMMQGQAFRAPTKGEEDAGVVKDQIPYITTVNDIGPDDSTGAIKLPYVAMVNGAIVPDESGNLSLGNVVTKNVWDGTSGEVLLRGAFGLGGAGITLNEPDLVSFFKACRAFGSGYYRNDTAIGGLPAYSAGFYSKTADTHSFICPQYSSGIVFVGTINDNVLDSESPMVHTNILYGTANKPDLNNDTQGTLGISKGGTGATTVGAAKKALEVSGVFCNDNPAGGAFNSFQSPAGTHEIRITNDGLWGLWKNGDEVNVALPISSGGTGATDKGAALNNFGLGYYHTPRFAGVDLSNYENIPNSGILNLNRLKESDQNVVTQGRIYHEMQSNLAKITLHINNTLNGINRYIQFAETGDLTGLQDVHAANYHAGNGVVAQGWIKGGEKIYIQQTAGGNRELHMAVPGPNNDPGAGSWTNILQGNWYSGYWQVGGIRGGGQDLECFRIGVNNAGTDWKEFNFYNSYGGHISAQRGFRGNCIQGAWGLEWDYMGAPFHAQSITNNDGGWSPFVSGGTVSTGGYALRVGLGCISNGNAAWPDAVIKLNGDGRFHRAFNFRQNGSIYTWGNDPWGGNYDIAMNPSSDRDIKKDINYDDGLASYENIKQFKPTTFIYKLDKYNRVRRGVIAQDLYQIDPEYVKLVPGSPIIETPEHHCCDEETENVEGKIIDYNDDTLALDINPIAIDTALAVRYLSIKFEESQEELKTVKAELAELKALVATLVNK